MGFASEIQQFAEKTNRNINQVRRGIALDIFESIITLSPVGNPEKWLYFHPQKQQYVDYLTYKEPPPGYVGGTFRGNWQASINNPKSGILKRREGKNGSGVLNAASRVLDRADGDDTIWFVNNMPYGPRLEYDGWSGQAPNGMLRLSVQLFRQSLRDQIARLDK